MIETEIRRILSEIENKLTGEPLKDARILGEYGELYRGRPDNEALLDEIRKRLYAMAADQGAMDPQEISKELVISVDEDYADACRLIEQQRYDEAIAKLNILSNLIFIYPVPAETILMDFDSRLDALNFQSLYKEMLTRVRIGSHPMHPGHILYSIGALLIKMGREKDAEAILKRLLSYDPVCPRYVFELGEVYKRTGQISQAYNNAMWALFCASSRSELAHGYRDLAYCMDENGAYEDALMLYRLSLNFEPSESADAGIARIREKTPEAADTFDEEAILQRCAELSIPVGLSQLVRDNLAALDQPPAPGEITGQAEADPE